MRLDGKQSLPWIIAGIPLVYLCRRLKSWYTLKHLETYILSAPNGLEVHISPLGGIIQRLYVPDMNGELEDVVLGYDELDAYLVRCNYALQHWQDDPGISPSIRFLLCDSNRMDHATSEPLWGAVQTELPGACSRWRGALTSWPSTTHQMPSMVGGQAPTLSSTFGC